MEAALREDCRLAYSVGISKRAATPLGVRTVFYPKPGGVARSSLNHRLL